MDDHAINLAFSKKMIEQRKDWLTSWMEECKRRQDLGLSEIYLYEKNTRSVSMIFLPPSNCTGHLDLH